MPPHLRVTLCSLAILTALSSQGAAAAPVTAAPSSEADARPTDAAPTDAASVAAVPRDLLLEAARLQASNERLDVFITPQVEALLAGCSHLQLQTHGQRWQGHVLLDIYCGDGRRLRVPAEIRQQRTVTRFRAALARGHVLTADDMEMVDITDDGSLGTVADATPYLGLALNRDVRAAQLVSSSLFTRPVLVKAGQTVRLLAGTTQFQVAVSAVALSDGRRGDSIRARNLSSGRVVQAWVDAEGNLSLRPLAPAASD